MKNQQMTVCYHQFKQGLSMACRLWRWLTEPHHAIQDVAVRRKSRLLSTFLLLMFGLFLLLNITYYISISGAVVYPEMLM